MANQPSQRHIIGRRIADQAFKDNGGRKARRGSLQRNSSSRRQFIHDLNLNWVPLSKGSSTVIKCPLQASRPSSDVSAMIPGHSRASRNVMRVCEETGRTGRSGQTQRMQQDVTG